MKKARMEKVQGEGRKDYLISAVINFIAVFFFLKLPDWNITFLTDEYTQLQSVLITAVLICLISNLFKLQIIFKSDRR